MTVPLHLVVPGPLDQRTGGYVYDARIVGELRARGREVEVHSVAGRFPDADAEARKGLDDGLGRIADGSRVVVDGLALGGLPEVARRHARRLRLVGLVHHPLADETGLAPAERRRFRDAEAAALAAVRGVVATSAFTGARLAGFGVVPEAVRVVLPGTDPAPAAAGPGPGAPPRLLCVGTVTPRKGHDLLVQALARIADLDWECVCVGSLQRDATFALRVVERVEAAGLASRVALVGEVDEAALDAAWDAASVFVLPSWYEGYGMALAEAMARGLPVVSTTGGAIPGTVPPDAGLLVPPGDVAALTEALRRLLLDPDERAARAGAARRHAGALPGWGEQAVRFAHAVDTLAHRG